MKTVLVTGSTDGIGKKTALRLAEAGYFTIIHGRDSNRVEQTVDEIKKITNGRGIVDSCIFNFDSFDAVKVAAEELKIRFPKLDVLLNNAGTYQVERRLSRDGLELTMAVNHLGPTLLTLLLKPILLNAPKPRVIFVSSIAHNRGSLGGRDYNFEKSYNSYEAYAASKLANIITARRLASDWAEQGIDVYALHPGVITTKLLRIGFNTDGESVEKGSNTSFYLATEELDKKLSGEYFIDSKPYPVSLKAKNSVEAEAVWQWTLCTISALL